MLFESLRHYDFDKFSQEMQTSQDPNFMACMDPELLEDDGILTIEALSEILHEFQESEIAYQKKRNIRKKRLSLRSKTRKDATEAAAFQSRKSQFLVDKLSKTLELAKDAVADAQFQIACQEFRTAYAIVQKIHGKTSMEAASVLEKYGGVHVVMVKEFKANENVSHESFLVYSEALRVYEVLLSDENVERVMLILKKIMRLFHMGELNDNFWICPCIRSHPIFFLKKMIRLTNVWETTASRIAILQKELLAFVVYILRRRK